MQKIMLAQSAKAQSLIQLLASSNRVNFGEQTPSEDRVVIGQNWLNVRISAVRADHNNFCFFRRETKVRRLVLVYITLIGWFLLIKLFFDWLILRALLSWQGRAGAPVSIFSFLYFLNYLMQWNEWMNETNSFFTDAIKRKCSRLLFFFSLGSTRTSWRTRQGKSSLSDWFKLRVISKIGKKQKRGKNKLTRARSEGHEEGYARRTRGAREASDFRRYSRVAWSASILFADLAQNFVSR